MKNIKICNKKCTALLYRKIFMKCYVFIYICYLGLYKEIKNLLKYNHFGSGCFKKAELPKIELPEQVPWMSPNYLIQSVYRVYRISQWNQKFLFKTSSYRTKKWKRLTHNDNLYKNPRELIKHEKYTLVDIVESNT